VSAPQACSACGTVPPAGHAGACPACGTPSPAAGVRTCRVCGCTDDRACVDEEIGPCWWIEADLCSHCRPPSEVDRAVGVIREALAPILAGLEKFLAGFLAEAKAWRERIAAMFRRTR
jgi:hypothetical protein